MPTSPAPKDPLGYDVYAETLWARIQVALNKDAGKNKALGDDPLVIGLFGEWGAGKSHLLDLIYKKALTHANGKCEARQTDSTSGITVPVLFQPWKYEHEKHLLVPMLLHILAALKNYQTLAQTDTEFLTQKKDAAGKAVITALPDLIESFEKLFTASSKALALAEPASAVVSFSLAKMLAKWGMTVRKLSVKKAANEINYVDNGRFFYEFHEVLKHITRPGKHPYVQHGIHLAKNIHINFVVFIDDLDRCLPEKAVQSLELIKTIFNVESFAFVLALDDEVIERGIGHRYKEYELKDKKPKMPITGFEYLEKIVHLPFRIPALTKADALNLLRKFESDFIDLNTNRAASSGYIPKKWFHDRPLQTNNLEIRMRTGESIPAANSSVTQATLNLADFALSCFDSFVPRKLSRIVELFHQVVRVAAQRGRPIDTELGGSRDPRLVLSFVMLQLFQPELYRTLKRTKIGFDQLRDGFSEPDITKRLNPRLSDSDLWHWAAFHNGKKIPNQLSDVLTILLTEDKDSVRSPAQRIRIPIVERLVEHRAVQRHVFDPLKLIEQLQLSATHPAFALNDSSSQSYFSLLTATEFNAFTENSFKSVDYVEAEPSVAGAEFKPDIRIGENADASLELNTSLKETEISTVTAPIAVRAVYEKLVSSITREQEELPTTLNLAENQFISTHHANELLALLEAWLLIETANNQPTELKRKQSVLLNGLTYLAPKLQKNTRGQFWGLVNDAVTLPETPNTLTPDPALASLYCDVRSMLGQDMRFDPNRFYLPKAVFKEATEEPIIGFVRMAGGTFTSGHKDQNDNPHNEKSDAGAPFYMARSHTTVDQYAAFLASTPHKNEELWDKQGWQWVTSQLDTTCTDKGLKKWLALRTGAARHAPNDWAQQQRVGSRAVHSITWFEARAYARWLNKQLKAELGKPENKKLARYQVRLPTELQWEYAATAGGQMQPLSWDNSDNKAHQHANISPTNIGHASVPGCYAPNQQGLWDSTGNLWQFLDGIYQQLPDAEKGKAVVEAPNNKRLTRSYFHRFDIDSKYSDCIAIRGGGWVSDTVIAVAAFRLGIKAIDWSNNVGFRVVLSLDEERSVNLDT